MGSRKGNATDSQNYAAISSYASQIGNKTRSIGGIEGIVSLNFDDCDNENNVIEVMMLSPEATIEE